VFNPRTRASCGNRLRDIAGDGSFAEAIADQQDVWFRSGGIRHSV
jgi:hypothetical protein